MYKVDFKIKENTLHISLGFNPENRYFDPLESQRSGRDLMIIILHLLCILVVFAMQFL